MVSMMVSIYFFIVFLLNNLVVFVIDKFLIFSLTLLFQVIKMMVDQHNKPNFSGHHFMQKHHSKILVLGVGDTAI